MACATAWLQAAGPGRAPPAGARGGGRGVGHPRQPRRGPVAPGVLEAVAGPRRRQRGRPPPPVRPALGGRRRLRAGGPGRGAAGRLRDPGRLRPAAGRGRAQRRAPRPHRHRGRRWSPSSGGAWPSGRWAGGRSWSSTGSASDEVALVDTDAAMVDDVPGRSGPLSGAVTAVGLAAFAFAGLFGRDGRAVPRPGRHPDRRPAPDHAPSRAPGAPSDAAPVPGGRRPVHGTMGPGRASCGRCAVRSRRTPPQPLPGRLVLGYAHRRLLAAERSQSVIVFGPTQSRKTSGFAVPAILGWEGPVVATSVKADLVGDTLAAPAPPRDGVVLRPHRRHGPAAGRLVAAAASATWPGARRTAASLTEVAGPPAGSMADGDFWYATAAKLLAPLLLAAATGGRRMADVVRWVDTQEESEVLDLLRRRRGARGGRRRAGRLRPRGAPTQLDVHDRRDRPRALRRPGGRAARPARRRRAARSTRPPWWAGRTPSSCARPPTTSAGSARCSPRCSARCSSPPTTR